MLQSGAFNFWQSQIARTNLGLWAAVKLRNQCEAIIGKRMNDGIHGDSNGESRLLDVFAPSARVVIDVGANVGAWFDSINTRSKLLERALLVEPGREALSRLCTKYSGDSRITLVDQAASDEVGETQFAELPNASEESSLVLTPGQSAAARLVPVRTTTIDQLVVEHRIEQVDILKIDAEGVDMRVLRGARNTIGTHAVKLVQFEYNSSWAYSGDTLGGALAFFAEHAYKVFLLKHQGLFEFDYERFREFFRYSNFVAVAPETLSTAKALCRGPIMRPR